MGGWVKHHDDRLESPNLLEAGPLAEHLDDRASLWSNRALTDGFIPTSKVRTLVDWHGVFLADEKGRPKPVDPMKLAERLVDADRWEVRDGGFYISDYLELQQSKDQILASREWDTRRRALYRDTELVAQIRARDGDCCRYCSIDVNWTDRRSARGGTYDHVVPRGPNTLDNLVVACRGCNSRKRDRTPDEAGMELRPIPTSGAAPGSTPDLTPIQPDLAPGVALDSHKEGRQKTEDLQAVSG